MKVSAELALRQSLTLTYEMRLAIDMLSMSAMEIEDVIDEELLKNPFLEEGEHYQSAQDFASYNRDGSTAFDVALNTAIEASNFRHALLQQIGEGSFNVIEREIAHHIITNLDDDGLLSDHEDIFRFISDDLEVFPEWIESVRRRLMDLEPIGCGARDSGEAVIHQAQRLFECSHEEFLKLVQEIRQAPERKLSFSRVRRMKADDALCELRKLKPRPSSGFQETGPVIDGVFAEVMVTQDKEGFSVTLLKKPSERLALKTNCYRGKHDGFMRESQKRALFMMKALHYRETNLAKVCKALVSHQEAWLLGQGSLKPLNLSEIADICGLHESSVSRLTKGKYLLCDRGCFELKYFFSSKIVRDDTEESQSAAAVKNLIKSIISKEDKKRPLSDEKILLELKGAGSIVSRRTITKYRESLRIGPAHSRRSIM